MEAAATETETKGQTMTAHSSEAEHPAHNRAVAGSNPAAQSTRARTVYFMQLAIRLILAAVLIDAAVWRESKAAMGALLALLVVGLEIHTALWRATFRGLQGKSFW